ncbi:hypothetical protein SHIRM173S_07446 [Streptomyces hirsutus]
MSPASRVPAQAASTADRCSPATRRRASNRPKLERRSRRVRRRPVPGKAGAGSSTRSPPASAGRAAAAASAPGTGRSVAPARVAECISRSAVKSSRVRERSTSRWRTEGRWAGSVRGASSRAGAREDAGASQRSGTTANTVSSPPSTPSSSLSRDSSNHMTGARRSPRAAAQIRQVCTRVPTSVETTWKEKLLYLKEFCQYLTPRIRYWSVSRASAGASGPSARRTRSVTSPASSRCRACRWMS